MKSYLVKTPKLVQRSLSERVWAFPNKTNEVYLTFDDGPIPEVTPWVLDTLASFNAKATFFCIGDNIKKHPSVFKKVLKENNIFSYTDSITNIELYKDIGHLNKFGATKFTEMLIRDFKLKK